MVSARKGTRKQLSCLVFLLIVEQTYWGWGRMALNFIRNHLWFLGADLDSKVDHRGTTWCFIAHVLPFLPAVSLPTCQAQSSSWYLWLPRRVLPSRPINSQTSISIHDSGTVCGCLNAISTAGTTFHVSISVHHI